MSQPDQSSAGREPAKVHKPGCHHGQHRPTGAQCRCLCNGDWPLPDHPTPVGSAAEANLEGRFNQIDHALTKQYWGEAWDRPDVRKRVIMDILKLTYAQGLRRGAELATDHERFDDTNMTDEFCAGGRAVAKRIALKLRQEAGEL